LRDTGPGRTGLLRLASRPAYQGLALLAAALLAMAANRLLGSAGFEWVIGALALLSFEVANPVLSAWAKGWWRYLLESLAVLAAMFLLMPLGAMLISARSYQEIGETAMVYLVVMYYPFTMGLAGLVRMFIRVAGRGRGRPDGPRGSGEGG
jgi:hypothetical protein